MRMSIIVPVYNGVEYISRCLDSILAQIDGQTELIVVDDASSDGTFELLAQKYRNDTRVILVGNSVNFGVAEARNTGIRLARGILLAFCDADDEWAPDRFAKMTAYLDEHPETEILFSGELIILDQDNEDTRRLEEYAVKDKLHFRCAVIRREVFDKVGLMDEDMRLREDTEWLVRARVNKCAEAFLDEPLYIRHIRSDGLSAAADPEGKKQRTIDSFIRGIRQNSQTKGYKYDLSILIPVFNARNYVIEAIDSCVSGHYTFEIIAVNDGSSDMSADLLLKILADRKAAAGNGVDSDTAPLTVCSRSHKGQAFSRNDAYHMARGRMILYLDADDYFLPGAVDVMMKASEEDPDAMMISALCRDFISPELTEEEASRLSINKEPYRRMLAGCMLISRGIFEKVGTYNEAMSSSETAEWVMKIRDAGLSIREIDNVVLFRRYHKANLGRTNRETQMNSYLNMIRNRLKNKQDGQQGQN